MMDPSDLHTHLPPRKRLLAGLRTPASVFDPPSPPADLQTIEAARAAATAAADAAAAARAIAAEKAAVAAKARAAARAAMEFLDSFSGTRTTNGFHLKVRSRNKHVQVKLLYKPNGRSVEESKGPALLEDLHFPPKPRRRGESDQDHLHRATSSSPRISSPTGPKRPRSTFARDEAAEGLGRSSSAHAPAKRNSVPNDHCSKDSSSGNAAHSRSAGIRNLTAARKVKIKRKELLLNQNTSEAAEDSVVPPGESKCNNNGANKHASPADAKAPHEGLPPMKTASVWKSKKVKTSHRSSHSKVLHKV